MCIRTPFYTVHGKCYYYWKSCLISGLIQLSLSHCPQDFHVFFSPFLCSISLEDFHMQRGPVSRFALRPTTSLLSICCLSKLQQPSGQCCIEVMGTGSSCFYWGWVGSGCRHGAWRQLWSWRSTFRRCESFRLVFVCEMLLL